MHAEEGPQVTVQPADQLALDVDTETWEDWIRSLPVWPGAVRTVGDVMDEQGEERLAA